MLKMIRVLLLMYSGRAHFFGLVCIWYARGTEDFRLIEKAYNVAEREFQLEIRDSGRSYFEHLEATAIIILFLLAALGLRDASLVAAALLHDIIEDIPGWSYTRLEREFNRDVAVLVDWVSKEPIEMYGGSKERQLDAYHAKIYLAPRRPRLLKLCDNLHNMVTLFETQIDKQKRKVAESRAYYLPIAEEEQALYGELEQEIMRNENRLGIVGD